MISIFVIDNQVINYRLSSINAKLKPMRVSRKYLYKLVVFLLGPFYSKETLHKIAEFSRKSRAKQKKQKLIASAKTRTKTPKHPKSPNLKNHNIDFR